MKAVSFITVTAMTALSVLTLACRDNSTATTTTAATVPSGQGENKTQETSRTSPVTPPATAMNATPTTMPAMSDAQVLQVTHVANQGQMALAKLAQAKSQDARVKKLAAMLVNDHGDADRKAMDLATKDNLTLADSATSTSVKNDADQAMDDLKSKTGKDFDKAYVSAQISELRSALDAIPTTASGSDVRSFVQSLRPKLVEHLKQAQDLQAELAK